MNTVRAKPLYPRGCSECERGLEKIPVGFRSGTEWSVCHNLQYLSKALSQVRRALGNKADLLLC